MIRASVNVTPHSIFIICACVNAAEELKIALDLFVTAVENGKHMEGSKHYIGNAVDLRSKTFFTHDDKMAFLGKVLARLGRNYQGFLEDDGGSNEHFHFEYDPIIPGTVNA